MAQTCRKPRKRHFLLSYLELGEVPRYMGVQCALLGNLHFALTACSFSRV